jgi:hypothetical protein
MVASAGLVAGLGQHERTVEQGFDGGAGLFSDGALLWRRVIGVEQVLGDGGLAQQLGASALAQGFGIDGFFRRDQRDAIDAGRCEYAAHGHSLQAWRRGWFCPTGTFRRRERTTW